MVHDNRDRDLNKLFTYAFSLQVLPRTHFNTVYAQSVSRISSFFNKMFVEDSSQKNADRQRRNCNLSIFDPAREIKIKKDNWSETMLLAFFSLRKAIQYETNFINTPIM